MSAVGGSRTTGDESAAHAGVIAREVELRGKPGSESLARDAIRATLT